MSAEGQLEPEVIPPAPVPGAVKRALALQANKWKPGQSGNPGGKTPLHFECVRIARDMCPEALARAAEIMRQTADERAALVAIGIILDRGLGKPKEIKQEDQRVMPDMSQLDPSDLAAFRRIMMTLAGQGVEVLREQATPDQGAAPIGGPPIAP